jgi:hypothetical protein
MLWRHLCLVRAWSAAGLLSCSMFAAPALAEPEEPTPSSRGVTETVRVLDAKRSGELSLELRGQGQDRVRVSLRNTSTKRLNVILPPGLVASSAAGQGGRGGGGGFQSMGLGSVGNQPGAFGEFRATAPASNSGFQSVAVSDETPDHAVTVPAGRTVELSIPAVCLNFGIATPTPRDRFELMDVDDFTPDPRARKALRSLATIGTSHGVAQAVAWNVFNGVPFEVMAAQHSKVVNPHETSLAARFVEVLDASGSSDLVDPAYLNEGRVFVQVEGEGTLAAEGRRLGAALEGLHVLGLPVRVVASEGTPEAAAPALLVRLTLTGSQVGETRGRLVVARATRAEGWVPLGKAAFAESSTASVLDGPALARAVDRALASAFVTVKAVKKGAGSTTLKVENHLPFTLSAVVVRAGGSSGSPLVPYRALGVGPARTTLVPIEAAGGKVERVELGGL